jgi:3-deoxy-D-manno-octulosonic-acid transferase
MLGPFAGAWLARRARQGKEDAARLDERFGRYAAARPDGAVLWLHAASVGESGVALALLEAMAARAPSLSYLLSTGTRTSADLVARRALPRVTHAYAPLDRRDAVRRFLAHWRPDAGAFIESELWPHLILEAQARSIPLALVNARMSPATLRRWSSWRAAAKRLLGAFAFVSAADARTAQALAHIRGETLAPANLKLNAPAPRFDASARAQLAAEIGERPLWLAASTHAGEDEIILEAHRLLLKSAPGALLILVPRHPERSDTIEAQAAGAPRRALNQPIGAASVYIADTLGELGLFYDLAPVALVAGSLLPHLKGHNPIEPAKLGAAILTGPYVESFQDVFDVLLAGGGAVCVKDAQSLADAVSALWRDGAARERQLAAALAATDRGAEAFENAITRLLSLAPLAPGIAKAAHASA